MICMQLCVYGIAFFIPTSAAASLVGRGCDCVVTGVGDWDGSDCGVFPTVEEGAGCCNKGNFRDLFAVCSRYSNSHCGNHKCTELVYPVHLPS